MRRAHSTGSMSTRSGFSGSGENMISARSDISSGSYGSVDSRPYSIRKSQSFEYTNTIPFTVHQKSPYAAWQAQNREVALQAATQNQDMLNKSAVLGLVMILNKLFDLVLRNSGLIKFSSNYFIFQDPLPLRKSNYQNTVLSIERTKPGYQGYLCGEHAENVYAKIHSAHVKRCAETRPYLQKKNAFYGPRWDGVAGYVDRRKIFS